MMKHCLSALALTLAAGLAAPELSAQAIATATGKTLAVGVAYQNIDPDYGPSRASGLQIFANYDFSRYVGLTAEANLQTAFSNVVFLEHTYLFGARGEYRRGKYMAYGKALIGDATASNNSNNPGLLNAPGSYPIIGLGGGLDIRLEHHITVRAIDYEDQHWFTYQPNSLTPHMLSFGAAYRFGEY
ncbi:MAG TPA: outer membrane beta-barrel protein [Acidobacteriaceae bacterium]|nr:outer membrane beta-barrel protein [Acidobacteriaceae bacterium]